VSDKASKLLQRAKSSPNGWMKNELLQLYMAFGFIIEEGRSHCIAKHPDHPEVFAAITRSSKELSSGYVRNAVSLIEKVKKLESKNG